MISRTFFVLSVLVALAAGLASGYALHPTLSTVVGDAQPHITATLDSSVLDANLTEKRLNSISQPVDGSLWNDPVNVIQEESVIIQHSAFGEQQNKAWIDLVENLRSRNTLLNDYGEHIVLDEVDYANLHNQLSQFLQQHESMVGDVLASYSTIEDPTVKTLLRSLLGELNTLEVEQFAIGLTASGDSQTIAEGVDLLAYMDASNSATRDALFQVIQNTTDADVTAAALRAMRPQILPLDARQNVEQRINDYVASEHPSVRAAVIEQLSAWSGSDSAQTAVSKGLFDESEEVRSAAIFAASNSRIRSNSIRQRLVEMVADDNESWDLREQSYRALKVYPLLDSEHQAVYQFHQQLQKLDEHYDSQS